MQNKPPMSDADKMAVWYDNQRDNQIGGLTDGITPEVAKDIGYNLPQSNKEDSLAPPKTSASTLDILKMADEIDKRIDKAVEAGESGALTEEEARILNEAERIRSGNKNRPGVDPAKPTTEMPGRHGRSNWQY